MIKQSEVNELKVFCTDARVMNEAGISYILIPTLHVFTNKGAHTMCALLCPSQHPSGYMTRLFFDVPLHGAGQSQNWTEHRILERTWHTWSWQNVSASQTLAQILLSHLDALK